MIFNLVKLLAVASIALAAPSSPLLEGPVTVRECKAYHYRAFCCDEIIDNYGPTIDLFGSSSENIDTLMGFSCRPPSALNPTCTASNGHHLCCTADALRGLLAFGCQKIIS